MPHLIIQVERNPTLPEFNYTKEIWTTVLRLTIGIITIKRLRRYGYTFH